jgi:hypothetical protein
VACAKLVQAVDRVSLAVEGDAHHVAARLAFDVGSTERLRAGLLAPPGGWDVTARSAALAAQWNLDLARAPDGLAPCLAALGAPVALVERSETGGGDPDGSAGGAGGKAPRGIDQTGVRAARAMLVGFDPHGGVTSMTGAIALDVTSPAYLERQLDEIPLRRALERTRTFGPYRGHAIAIPFSATVEYVLEPHLAIAALGDGLLARLVAPAPAPGRVPIAALDVAPPAMSARAWQGLLELLAELGGGPGAGSPATARVVALLMGWRDAHLTVTAEGSEVVVAVSGDRR